MRDDQSKPDEKILGSDLLDLRGTRLADLEKLPSSALLESVRRILEQSEKEPTSYQQFDANI
jgi:FXSXX-COOH protein